MERKKRNRIAALLLAVTTLLFLLRQKPTTIAWAKAARFAIRLMLAKTH